MPAIDSVSHIEEVVHIIDTYALPMPAAALDSMRRQVRESNPSGGERLAEEEAALFLTRHLHAAVIHELRSGLDSSAMGGILDAWSKFAQQAMYRADLGLINAVLYRYEILPLIDDVERLLREGITADNLPRASSARPPWDFPL